MSRLFASALLTCSIAHADPIAVYIPQVTTFAVFAWDNCQPWLPYAAGTYECLDAAALVTTPYGPSAYIGAPDMTVIDDASGITYTFTQCQATRNYVGTECSGADLIFTDGIE